MTPWSVPRGWGFFVCCFESGEHGLHGWFCPVQAWQGKAGIEKVGWVQIKSEQSKNLHRGPPPPSMSDGVTFDVLSRPEPSVISPFQGFRGLLLPPGERIRDSKGWLGCDTTAETQTFIQSLLTARAKQGV